MAVTFESVDAEIKSLDLDALQAESLNKDIDIKSKLCSIWKKVGGIVRLIINIPFIPKRWRAALEILVSTLDSLCD